MDLSLFLHRVCSEVMCKFLKDSIRKKMWHQVGERQDGSLPSSWFNNFFAYSILFSIILVVAGTEVSKDTSLSNGINRLEALGGFNYKKSYLK